MIEQLQKNRHTNKYKSINIKVNRQLNSLKGKKQNGKKSDKCPS